MNSDHENFYNIWELILSRQPKLISQAFKSLDAEEQQAVLDHLKRMRSESGWQPGQRESAQAALEVIMALGETGSE